MKKLIFLVTLATAVLFSAVASGQQGAEQETVTLKFNSVLSSMDPNFGYWSEFCDSITEASAGSVDVEIYPTEALGKTTDMIEAISKGAPILQDCDPSHLADYVADYSIFMHPYLFNKPEDIATVWKSDIGQKLEDQLHEKGLRIVTLVYFGTRNLISNKAVTKREDTADLKIRCAATKMWIEVAKTLGGNPTNTAWSEVYTALSQGVADAAESPVSLLYSAKLYEPRKHISRTEHLIAPTAIVMSEEVYQSLSPEGQAAIDKIGSEYPAKRIELVRALEKEFEEKLMAEGVEFHDVDKSGFLEAAKNVSANFPEWTPNLYADIRAVLE